jgi:2-polyprenyl-3-methyl-5-hydroxy-6-metoxy-1,4-benzoquinol methylase
VRRFVRSRRRGADDGDRVWFDAADAAGNVAWNRQRWGDETSWRRLDMLGYRWSGGALTTPATMARMADTYLRPYLGNRYDLAVLEISPGGGRMTAELLRHASRMSLVDLNAAAIKVCRERFGRLPTPIEFVVNDGQSLAGITGTGFDFIACYDSMVHMHPRVDVGTGNGVARPQRTRPTRRRFAYRDDG